MTARPAKSDEPAEAGPLASLPKRFGINLTSSYLRTAVAAVIGLVTVPILVDGLGKEAYGIWVIIGALALYREILQFGLAKATPKYVAEYTALGDPERVRSAVATSFWLLMIPAALALAIGFGLVPLFPELFGISPGLKEAAQVLLVLVVINFAISIPSDAFGGVLIGLQRFDLLNWTLIVIIVAQAVGWVIVLAAGGGLVALGVVTITMALTGQLWRLLISRRLIPGLSVSPRRVDRKLIRPFAGLSFWYGVIDIANILLIRVDTIVVGLVLGVEAAAVYAVAQKIPLAAGSLVSPISRVFFPHSSELAALDDVDRLRRSVIAGTRMMLGAALPLVLIMSLLAGPTLDVWVGSGFAEGATVIVILSFGNVIAALNQTGLQMLQGMGRARGPALVYGCEGVLNVVLSVLFANLIGIEGVALGTVLASFAASLVAFFPYMCRQFGLPLVGFVRSLIVSHLPPVAAGLAVGWLVTRGDISSVIPLLGAAVAIGGAYVAVFVLTGVDSNERRELVRRIRRTRIRSPLSESGTGGIE